MAMSVVRHLPIISTVGGVIGGIYWTILPDLTITSYGAPATKSRLSYFEDEKGLDGNMSQLTKEVEDKLLLNRTSIDTLSSIEYFWCKSLDVVAIGNATMRKSSFIGLPVNFLYQNVDQVKLPADYPDNEQLQRAMVLSDAAKKFAVTSAYYQLDSIFLSAQILIVPTVALGPYAAIYYLQRFFQKKSLARQLSLFFAVCAGSVVVLKYVTQFAKYLNVCYADKFAAELGEEYLNGGLEYFTKTLERNKAIHAIDGGKAGKMVDSKGNQVYRFFDIAEPLFTHRLERLKNIAESCKQKSE